MSRWILPDQDDEWAALFTGFTKSAYRLEGKQRYSSDVEDAAVARFAAGEPHGIDLSWTIDKVKDQVAAGCTQTNVRVVVEPSNDYTRMELVCYETIAAAGEDIRIISVPEGAWPEGLPQHDYWLFDDRDVWRMHYDDNDRFTGAELLTDE